MRAALDTTASEAVGDPEKKRRFNQSMFTVAATRYDLATRAMSLMQDRRWKRLMVARLPAMTAPRCVDLACGTGDIAFLLSDRYPESTVIGVDQCDAMLRIAKEMAGNRKVEFRTCDMSNTSLPDGDADIVTGAYALRNAHDLDACLEETRRLLRVGGIAVFLDFSRPDNRLAQAVQRRLLWSWCGLWGVLLHGNPNVHGYIAESLRAYPSRSELIRLVELHGLKPIHRQRHLGGVVETIMLERSA